MTSVAPDTGASFPLIAHIVTCIGWPAPVSNPPAPLPAGVPPLLGAGTWSDFPGTNRVIEQVPGSVSIFHDGPGHVLYTTGNACAIEHVDRYFLTRALPPAGTTLLTTGPTSHLSKATFVRRGCVKVALLGLRR